MGAAATLSAGAPIGGLAAAAGHLREVAAAGDVTLDALSHAVGPRGHAFLCLALAVPFVQPIPLAGLSVVLGPLLVVLSILIAVGRPPRIPRQWGRRPFPHSALALVVKQLDRCERLSRRYLRVRRLSLIEGRRARLMQASVIGSAAILLALPLPIPFTNTLPALAIVAASIGMLERDGACLLASFALLALAIAYFGALGLLGAVLLQ